MDTAEEALRTGVELDDAAKSPAKTPVKGDQKGTNSQTIEKPPPSSTASRSPSRSQHSSASTTKATPTASSANTDILEKTTEGVLKAARLGDLRMLTELHSQGYSLLSIDETGKTALHYGARFGHKEVVRCVN